MSKTASIILTIAMPAFAIGLLFGQKTAPNPTLQELNSSAHDLCQELGGQWKTDSEGWCDIDL